MKINFCLSDTTKGATTAALNKVIKAAGSNILENNIIIVPETKSIIIEKELLKLSEEQAFLNVFVYSFVRLLDRFKVVSKDHIVSKQTCVIMLRKIIYENESKLLCYKKSAKMVSFAEKIYDTIAQFKSSGITLDDLKQSLEMASGPLKLKLSDIVLLFDEYEKALTDSLFDDCDKLALISKFSSESDFLKSSNVYVVGFDNITFEMEMVLRDLAKNSKEITFSCVYIPASRKNSYIQPNELYGKFKSIADHLHYPYNPEMVFTQKSTAIKHIQYSIFSQKYKKKNSCGQVRIFKARTVKEEIDFVANTILCEISQGKRFKDIGVLATNLTENLDIIEDCFKTYKIPYFANISRQIDKNFIIRFIQSAFEVFTSRLSADKVLEFISNPLFECEDFSLFVSFVNRRGINYRDFLIRDEAFWSRDPSEAKSENLKEKIIEENRKILSIINKFYAFYDKFDKILKNSYIVEDYIRALEEMLKDFNVQAKVDEISELERENDLLTEAEITGRILDKVNSMSEQLLNFFGKTRMPLQEFVMIFMSGFASVELNLSPISIDCVVIQENTDGFYNIKDLFIMGAVEGTFPAKLRDSGIILDSELLETEQIISKKIEPAVSDINRREKYKVYEALLEPTEKLFVSYSVKGLSGKNNIPDRVVKELGLLFSDKIETDRYVKTDLINRGIIENRFVREVNNYLSGPAKINLPQGVNYLYSQLADDMDERIKYALTKDTLQPLPVNYSDIYFIDNKTSVSQFETYFDCPYKFFVKYGLRLKENENATMSLPDVGIIMHSVAEKFGRKLREFSDDKGREKLKTEISDIVSDILRAALEDNNIRVDKNKALIGLLSEESLRLCKYMLSEQENSGFKIYELEKFFSDDSVVINPGGDKVISFSGKIDRIDKFSDFIRVIDYKTGKIDTDLKSIYYGNKIQLAIYLKAVESGGKFNVAGIYYLPIHSKYTKAKNQVSEDYRMKGLTVDNLPIVKNMDFTLSETSKRSIFVPITIATNKDGEVKFDSRISGILSKEEFDNLCDYTIKLCSTAASEILSGFKDPSPIASKSDTCPRSCKYCKVGGFCGVKNSPQSYGRNLDGTVKSESFYLEDK